MDSDSGVTSIRMTLCAADDTTMPFPAASFPALKRRAHRHAFIRIHIAVPGIFPVSFLTISCTAGMRVLPPTSNTCPKSLMLSAASVIT